MVTKRFDVFRNPSVNTSRHVPFLLVVQSELLEQLPTRVVVPLARASSIKGPSATLLNPEFQIDSMNVVMLTQQIASVPLQVLKRFALNLESERSSILRALDFLFSGI